MAELQRFLSSYDYGPLPDPYGFFFQLYNKYADCHYRFTISSLNYKKIINFIGQYPSYEFNVYNSNEDNNSDQVLFVSNKYNLVINIRPNNFQIFTDSPGAAQPFVDYFNSISSKSCNLNFIYMEGTSYHTSKNEFISNEDFSLDHYNDDFENFYDTNNAYINKDKQSGFILLYGEMGTGKSSYIKNIIKNAKKEVYYVPPDLMSQMTLPNMVGFLTRTINNSIMVIEDAENILKQRDVQSGNQAVSNILNMTDGILGGILSSIIICTINCPLEHIDQALLRPGRLLSSYQFNKLSVGRTRSLMKKLHNVDVTNVRMTLAEIFNNQLSNKMDKKFGFI